MNRLAILTKPRAPKIGVSLIAIVICTSCLWSAIFRTSDITDDFSANGGYNRGAIFYLQRPIAVSKNKYAHPLDLPRADPSNVQIHLGCRLKIIRVRSLYGIFAVPADNIPRMSAEAQFVDGPLTGTTVDITWISARAKRRRIKVDPAYLQPTAPTSLPASGTAR